MKISEQIDKNLKEPEIIIRAANSFEIKEIRERMFTNNEDFSRNFELFDGKKQVFVELSNIIFFESAEGKVWAHTDNMIFINKSRLYELRQNLPDNFTQISKSAIVNRNEILSIRKNLAGPSEISFKSSRKRVNLSRNFYKILIEKMRQDF